MNDDTIVRAGEYVLGVLSLEERLAVERDAATDSALAAEIAYWNARFMPLVEAEEIEPPAELFDRIKAAIRADAQDLPGTLTVRGIQGHWVRLARGLERKILHGTPDGRVTSLIRGQPGARLPGHEHDEDEEIYVLEGELTIGTLTLRAG